MTSYNKDIPSFDFDKFKTKFITKDFLPFNLNEGIKIFKIQDVIKHLKFPLPLHRTNYYDILFIVKGYDSVKNCGIRKFEINAGSIFFKPAGQITSGDVLGNDAEGFFCLLDADFLSKYVGNTMPVSGYPFFKYTGNPVIKLNQEEIDRFQFLFETIHKQYYSQEVSEAKKVIIGSYFNVILQEANAIYNTQNKADQPITSTTAQLTSKFKDLVSAHYLSKREVKDYAALLFVSPNHLNKTIKAATGKTASTLIAEMLIMEAKVLLKQSSMSITEIANYLKFQDTAYFTRFFKKHTAITPSAFKK